MSLATPRLQTRRPLRRLATAVIDYTLRFADGRVLTFQAGLDPPAFRPAHAGPSAFWTKLEGSQCPGCPLVSAEPHGCPAARSLEAIGTAFADFASFETAEVEARTPERTIVKRTDLPTALRSFMGLKLALRSTAISGKPPSCRHLQWSSTPPLSCRMRPTTSWLCGKN